MQYRELRKAIRNGWILWVLAAIFIVLMTMFVRKMGDGDTPPTWDMGGESFVPASSTYGNGYFLPVSQPSERSAP